MKSKALRITLGVIAGIVILVTALSMLLPRAPEAAYYTNPRPKTMVIAHQGGDGVWPGDTLFAFEEAVAIGADVLEMDAHITKDGVIVLMHDETVDDTTDGTGVIEDMTLAELKQLDAAYDWSNDGGQTFPYRGQGITVPTLEELFQKFPDMRYTIELKKTKNLIDQPMCDLVRQYNMQDKVLIASFHDEAIAAFRATCPGVATSAARTEVTYFVILGKVFLSGLIVPQYQALQVPWEKSESKNIPIMTPRFIREAHAKNLAVEPWTVNDPDLMRQYIEWGVDGIITDRPDLLIAILNGK